MRVLQVVTHMNRGGLETLLMNYYRNIDRDKVQFDFLVHRQERGDYDDEIEAMGGKIWRMPILNPFSARYHKTLRTFFREHPEYQVVHVHQDCLSSVILKEAKRSGVPVRIAHSHCASQDHNLKYLVKLFYKREIPKYATHLMACGEAAGEWMFNGSSFEIIQNAIDTVNFSFDPEVRSVVRREWNIDERTLLVGHVGRFCPQKNHTFLVNVFSNLCKASDAKLILIGDGPLRTDIEKQVRELGLEKKVIFAGVRSDVNRLMQGMDLFLFPSLYEGLPVTLVEAQASGLPCLVSDGVTREADLTDLVEHKSLQESADAWTDEAIKLSKRTRGSTYRQIVEAGYDICKNVKKLQEFYISFGEKE